jgi:outer membrane cobalamin receptor
MGMRGSAIALNKLAWSLALALAMPGAGAIAADPKTADELTAMSFEELASISVSAASLLESNLLNAASSIAAVDSADWRRRGARRMLDAIEFQPGVMVLPHTSGNEVLAIRGYARSTSYAGVATSWDGVPLNDLFRSGPQFNLPSINLGALSQVQLIQGPGSALYGSDAFHGLIALRGFEADHDMAVVNGRIASNGYAETALQSSSTFGGDTRWSLALAANGQGDQQRRASYVSPTTGAPVSNVRANSYQAQTASIKFASSVREQLSWHGGLYYHHYDAAQFQGLGTRLSGESDLGWLNTAFWMAQAGLRQQLGSGGSLEAKAYSWWVDNDLESNLALATGPVHRDLLTTQSRSGLQAIYRDSWQPGRTEWALALGQEWLAVRAARADLRSPQGQLMSSTPNQAQGARRTVRSATLEMNTRFDGEHWKLVYGGRVDDYSDFGSHSSPRVGLIYQPQQGDAIKLLVGQAFRAPNAVEIGGAANSVLGNPNIQPEVINSAELVAMRRTEHYIVQATLFRTLWRDGIAAVLVPAAKLTQYQNVGRNDAKGISASLQYRAGSWLFDASGAVVASRNSITGVHYNIFPRLMADIGIKYVLADPTMQLGLNQRYMSSVDDVPSTEGFNVTPLPRFLRTDLSFSKEWSARDSATLQVRNLFNRDNRLPSPPASLGGIPDERLSVSLALSHRF